MSFADLSAHTQLCREWGSDHRLPKHLHNTSPPLMRKILGVPQWSCSWRSTRKTIWYYAGWPPRK